MKALTNEKSAARKSKAAAKTPANKAGKTSQRAPKAKADAPDVPPQTPDVAPEAAPAKVKATRGKKTPTAATKPDRPRATSKTAQLIEMLKRDGGALRSRPAGELVFRNPDALGSIDNQLDRHAQSVWAVGPVDPGVYIAFDDTQRSKVLENAASLPVHDFWFQLFEVPAAPELANADRDRWWEELSSARSGLGFQTR